MFNFTNELKTQLNLQISLWISISRESERIWYGIQHQSHYPKYLGLVNSFLHVSILIAISSDKLAKIKSAYTDSIHVCLNIPTVLVPPSIITLSWLEQLSNQCTCFLSHLLVSTHTSQRTYFIYTHLLNILFLNFLAF